MSAKKCTHNWVDMGIQTLESGNCPMCLKAEIKRLRDAVTKYLIRPGIHSHRCAIIRDHGFSDCDCGVLELHRALHPEEGKDD